MTDQKHDGAHLLAETRVDSAPESEGAPRKRGPSAFRCFFQRPDIRVWAGPASRALTLLLALSCVAMLGHAADHEASLGVRLNGQAGRAAVSLAAPTTNAQRMAHESSNAAADANNSACPVPPPCSTSSASTSSRAVLADGRIVLNEATTEDFERLPGIGQRRAEALVALRTKLGGFKRISDLLRVKGIGPKSLQKFKELTVLDRPVEPGDRGLSPANAAGQAEKRN